MFYSLRHACPILLKAKKKMQDKNERETETEEEEKKNCGMTACYKHRFSSRTKESVLGAYTRHGHGRDAANI